MLFDLLHVLKNFAVEDGRLFRRLASGHSREISVIERGRLVSVLDGRKYYGPDVAWACHYLAVPMFRVITLDGDPFNLAEDNLMPVRLKRLRYRVIEVPGGFRHPRTRETFPSERHAHADWVRSASRYYREDKPYVRSLEDQHQPTKPEAPEKRTERFRAPSTVSGRPLRPEVVWGRSWHWWEGRWLSLPDACHASDDWMVRAAVVSQSPGARFVYDSVAQRTVAVI